MRKSQRSRLTVLTAKEAATRSAEEVAEFTYLSTLATLHPDATKDIDDASVAAAVNSAPPATATASPAAGANAPPAATLGAVIKGALSTLGDKVKLGTDLATANQTLAMHVATIATRDTTIATHVATIAARDAQLGAINAQVGAFAAFFGLTVAELTGKDAAAVQTLLATKASALAAEQLATACVPPAQLPKATVATPENPAAKKTMSLGEFSKLTHADKMAFSVAGGRLTD